MKGNRIVHHMDAIQWLNEQEELKNSSIVTSLPDISEFPKFSIEVWKKWFVDTAGLVLSKCGHEGLVIFYQTDIKKEGVWIDKSFLCQKAAEQMHYNLVAHKIICRAPAGIETKDATGYSHLLCFSKTPKPEITKAFADVMPDAGETTWKRGMGKNVCELACRIVKEHTKTQTIVDPFCGHGGVLAVANELGLNAIGVDHKLKYAKKAKEQNLKSV